MRPSTALRDGAHVPQGKYNNYVGWWGHFGGRPQKGIIAYGVSANRQNPFAGALDAALFNSWRRFRTQVLYWAPCAIGGYLAMKWAVDRNHYLNSKEGRAEHGDEE